MHRQELLILAAVGPRIERFRQGLGGWPPSLPADRVHGFVGVLSTLVVAGVALVPVPSESLVDRSTAAHCQRGSRFARDNVETS